jgi:hypothetical protein
MRRIHMVQMVRYANFLLSIIVILFDDLSFISFLYLCKGCIDFIMEEHAGLDGIWCDECPLTEVWEESYSHISRRDFWVAESLLFNI